MGRIPPVRPIFVRDAVLSPLNHPADEAHKVR